MCSLYAFPKYYSIYCIILCIYFNIQKKRAIPNIMYININSFATHRKTHLAHPILTLSEKKFFSSDSKKARTIWRWRCRYKMCCWMAVSMCRWLPFKIIFMYFRVCLYTFRCNWTFANNFGVSRTQPTVSRHICSQTPFCC